MTKTKKRLLKVDIAIFERIKYAKYEVSIMLKHDFLEKPFDYMTDILLYIYNNGGMATKTELVKTFHISLPTLNEYLNSLRVFFEQNNLHQSIHLNMDGEKIYLEKEATFQTKHIVFLFLEKSIKFQLILRLFSNGEITGEYFQANYAISSATYYRKVTELNILLDEFNIKIKRGKLFGEEKQIRYFLFNFFWFIFEDKSELEKEVANQYIGLIDLLEKSFDFIFDAREILQIKLWMKICFKRISQEPKPLIHSDYDYPDRPLFEEINLVFFTYMKQIEYPCSIYEAYMFYDFFCSMNNFSSNSPFAYQLAKAQQESQSHLYYMNKIILIYLKRKGYLTSQTSSKKIRYIEILLFQLHSQIYYFDGFILPFDQWMIREMIYKNRHPFSKKEVSKLLEIASQKFQKYGQKPNYHNIFTRLNYTIIMDYIANLNEKIITIGVYHSMSPKISHLAVQRFKNTFNAEYPVEIESFKKNVPYDIVLSNIYITEIMKKNNQIYLFSDIGNSYDLKQIKQMIITALNFK